MPCDGSFQCLGGELLLAKLEMRQRHAIAHFGWLIALLVPSALGGHPDCRSLQPPGRSKSAILREKGFNECISIPPETINATLNAASSSERRIVATTSSYGFTSFTDNWIASLLGVGADEFVIISEDAWSYQRYNKELPGRVVHFELEEASERAKPFKSREYKELVSRRGALLWRLVSLGFDVLWADSDVVFLKNPLEAVEEHADQCDVQIQSDSACRWEGDLEGKCTSEVADPPAGSQPRPQDILNHEGSSSLLCTGIIFLKHNERTLDALDQWKANRGNQNQRKGDLGDFAESHFVFGCAGPKSAAKWGAQEATAKGEPSLNQPVFNDILLHKMGWDGNNFVQTNNSLRVCYLDRKKFPTGRLYYSDQWREAAYGWENDDGPVAVHLNWVSSPEDKRGKAEKYKLLWPDFRSLKPDKLQSKSTGHEEASLSKRKTEDGDDDSDPHARIIERSKRVPDEQGKSAEPGDESQGDAADWDYLLLAWRRHASALKEASIFWGFAGGVLTVVGLLLVLLPLSRTIHRHRSENERV